MRAIRLVRIMKLAPREIAVRVVVGVVWRRVGVRAMEVGVGVVLGETLGADVITVDVGAVVEADVEILVVLLGYILVLYSRYPG